MHAALNTPGHDAYMARLAKKPRVNLERLLQAQRDRSHRSKAMDGSRSSKRTISPFDPRTQKWMENPGGWDVRGLDDEHAKHDNPVLAADEQKHREGQGERPTPKPDVHAAPPVKHAPSVKHAPPVKATQPGRPPTPKAPEVKPEPKIEKDVKARLHHMRAMMGKLLPASKGKSRTTATPDQEVRSHDAVRAFLFGRKGPKNEANWKYDLGRGGYLTNKDYTAAIFRIDAKPLDKKAMDALRGKVPGLASVDLKVMGKAWTQQFEGDLGTYLKAIDPTGHADHLPLGGSAYPAKELRELAKAFPGRVTLRTGRDAPLYVQQGRLGALLAPNLEEGVDYVERHVRNQATPTPAKGAAPNHPASAPPKPATSRPASTPPTRKPAKREPAHRRPVPKRR
jgi:hypothetical protein